MKHLKHIAVCGNIGSGKTSLVEKLSSHYTWKPLYEEVHRNPYLRDFYEDMTKWAFHLQIYFLNNRFNQVRQICSEDRTVIQDRTIYEDAYIFAASLHESGYMNDSDYQSYLNIFNAITRFVQPPDLLIYLQADVSKLNHQIRKRGRNFEHAISPEYLKNLNEHYEAWIANYHLGKVLTIDANELDFVNKDDDFIAITAMIDLAIKDL